MATRAGSGVSTERSSTRAIVEALNQAREPLEKPTVGFIFTSPKHDLGQVLKGAKSAFPEAEFVGCTTAGEITERGLAHDSVSVLLVQSDESVNSVGFAETIGSDFDAAGKVLAGPYAETKKAAFAQGKSASTTIALCDGLCGGGEKLVRGLRAHTSAVQQIAGGAAGDEGAFETTWVGYNESCGKNSAVAVHTFGKNLWGIGVDHGLTAATDQLRVTRSEDNVVHELNGKPAFDAYLDFAKSRDVSLERDSAGPFMIQHELGIHFFDRIARARAPLSVDTSGAITCAADVPEGSFISILDGDKNELIKAAKNAAEEAKNNLEGPAAGILLFDCICRGMILGDMFSDEIGAVQSVFPGVPIVGFLTYGEIARYTGKLDGWHNTTAVVAAIPTR